MRRITWWALWLVSCNSGPGEPTPDFGAEPPRPAPAAPTEPTEATPSPSESAGPEMSPAPSTTSQPTGPTPEASAPSSVVPTPAGVPEGTGDPVQTIVADSAAVRCQQLSSTRLTIGSGDSQTVLETNLWYARLSVPGLTPENFISAFADSRSLVTTPGTSASDPCAAYDASDIDCSYTVTGNGPPDTIASYGVGLARDGDLFVYCGASDVDDVSISAIEVTIWYRYLSQL